MKKFYVIGDPIAQSKSPDMHNAAFRALEMDAEFFAEKVTADELEDWIVKFRETNGAGACVTIPHKEKVMQYLDYVDEFAEAVGAVNVIVNIDGELHGYNTDGQGFVSGLQRNKLPSSRVLILGAGGAAKGIMYGLIINGVNPRNITIANRTLSRAEELCGKVMTLKDAEKNLGKFNLIINTTSVGMFPDANKSVISLKNLAPNSTVCDAIYNPLETKFLAEARKKGATIVDGLSMFVGQGELAFIHWTKSFPNREIMRNAVIDALKK